MWNIQVSRLYYGNNVGSGYESYSEFIAIAPVFLPGQRNQKERERPINRIRLTGVAVNSLWFNSRNNENAKWHPDNPCSVEKWIELEFSFSVKKEVVDHSITGPIYRYEDTLLVRDRQSLHSRFWVPAQQLIPFTSGEPIVFQSKDREAEYGKLCVERWNDYIGSVGMRSYY